MSKPTIIRPPRPQCDAVAVARRIIGKVQYALMSNGQLIRHSPLRPYNTRSERKQVIRQRRLDKEGVAA